MPRVGSEEPAAEWAVRRTTKTSGRGGACGERRQRSGAAGYSGNERLGEQTRARAVRPAGGDFAAAVYGSILAAAVVASLDVGDVAAPAMTVSLGGTMVVFWLAHVWADAVADRMRDARARTSGAGCAPLRRGIGRCWSPRSGR